MGKKIEYSNGELTIIWQPELCKHAGICVKTLPQVYNPKERPWIKIENATFCYGMLHFILHYIFRLTM